MKFGVCLPNFGNEFNASGFLNFAKEVESLGFDSVWTTDHILMPSKSGTPYERILESLTSLASLTFVTTRVKLGVSSLVMGMRNPAVVAKQLATIDYLSSGRLILATGAGWNEAEFGNVGADFHTRGKRLDEAISMIRLLWSSNGAPVNFRGRHLPHVISNGVFSPSPVQSNLQIWIAGVSEKAIRRAAKLGDAWHPNLQPLDGFSVLVQSYHKALKGSNKPICARVAFDPGQNSNVYRSPQGEPRFVLSGIMSENERVLQEYEKLGVSYAVIAPDPTGKLPLDRQLEGLRRLASHFLGK